MHNTVWAFARTSVLAVMLAVLCISPGFSQKKGSRTIVDQTGATVTLPAKIERVVITSIWPLPSVFCLVDGSGKKLVGIHPASMSAAQTSMLAKTAPDILKASTKFVQGTTINVEELLKLRPDVVFYSAANTAERELIEKAGLVAVGFSTTIAQYDTLETVTSWMDLLGEILGKESRAAELKEYGKKNMALVNERMAKVTDAKKPKTLILFRHSDKEILASGQKFFGDFWLKSTGAINVAGALMANQKVNMEQIYAWNPDIIYITNFSPSLPEDFYNNSISGQDWSGIKAVQNRKVFKIPLGHYRWFPPSSDAPLMVLWMAKKNHPEIFADIDFEAELRSYFKKFHNYTLTDGDIKSILNPPREAANGV